MLVISQRQSDSGIRLKAAQSECVVRVVYSEQSPAAATLKIESIRGYVEAVGMKLMAGGSTYVFVGGHEVAISVERVERGKTRLGFKADRAVSIVRLELLDVQRT